MFGMGHLGRVGTLGAGGGGNTLRWLNAATMSSLQDTGEVALNTHRVVTSRFPRYFGWKPKNNVVRLVFENWYFDSTGILIGNTGTKTILKVALENAAQNDFVPVTFANTVMAAADSGNISLDVTLPASWNVGPDTLIWERSQVLFSTTGTPRNIAGRLVQEPVSLQLSQCYTSTQANAVDQIYGTGLLTLPTGGVAMTFCCGGSSFLLAVPDDPTTAISAAIIAGDSQVSTNDIAATNNPVGTNVPPVPIATGATWIGRAANSDPTPGALISGVIPWARLSCTGASLHGVFGGGAGTIGTNKIYYPLRNGWFNIGIPEIGVNDSTTLANNESEYLLLCQAMRSNRIKRIVGTLISPLTNGSLSAWTLADGSDQVFGALGGPGGQQDLWNQYRASLLGNGVGPDIMLPFTSIRLNSNPANSDYYKWLANGVPTAYTRDGLHSSFLIGNTTMAPEARTAILAAAAMGPLNG